MNFNDYETLSYLKTKENNRLNQVFQKFYLMNSCMGTRDISPKQVYLFTKLAGTFLQYGTTAYIEKEKRQNILMKNTSMDLEDMVWSTNDLQKKPHASCVLTDIKYSSAIKPEKMKQIKIVWDSFDSGNIKDSNKLSIEFVGGNYITHADTLPDSLEYVCGNIVAHNMTVSSFEDVQKFANLKHVGGQIYCHGQAYTFEEIRSVIERKYTQVAKRKYITVSSLK